MEVVDEGIEVEFIVEVGLVDILAQHDERETNVLENNSN